VFVRRENPSLGVALWCHLVLSTSANVFARVWSKGFNHAQSRVAHQTASVRRLPSRQGGRQLLPLGYPLRGHPQSIFDAESLLSEETDKVLSAFYSRIDDGLGRTYTIFDCLSQKAKSFWQFWFDVSRPDIIRRGKLREALFTAAVGVALVLFWVAMAIGAGIVLRAVDSWLWPGGTPVAGRHTPTGGSATTRGPSDSADPRNPTFRRFC
jgi:hypothetical protein